MERYKTQAEMHTAPSAAKRFLGAISFREWRRARSDPRLQEHRRRQKALVNRRWNQFRKAPTMSAPIRTQKRLTPETPAGPTAVEPEPAETTKPADVNPFYESGSNQGDDPMPEDQLYNVKRHK